MDFNPVHVLRLFQFLLAVVSMALSASVAFWFNHTDLVDTVPTQIIFLLFASVWTILIAIPYTTATPRFFPKIANKYIMLGMESSTALFWLGGFAATADFLRKLSVCRGSVCGCARAGVVFGVFECLLFAGTTLFAVWHVFNIGSQKQARNKRALDAHEYWTGKQNDQV